MPNVDYAAELERIERKHAGYFVGVEIAATATRTLRFETPAMARRVGYVWSALDVWVQAGRPEPRDPLRPHYHNIPASPYDRLTRALVDLEVGTMWDRIVGFYLDADKSA